MSVWRNFFLGSEPTKGMWPLEWIDKPQAKRIAKDEMAKMGIDIRDTEQPVGTLSGGERQSVAIARAVYFGAKVLILDDSTSALDVATESRVQAAIPELYEGITTIYIAQRISAVIDLDRIVLMENGRITAIGTHEELLASSPLYQEIYESQLGGVEEEKA